MHRAGDRVTEDLLLEDPDLEQVGESRPEGIRPRVVKPTEPQREHEPLGIPGKEPECSDDDQREDDVDERQASVSALAVESEEKVGLPPVVQQ